MAKKKPTFRNFLILRSKTAIDLKHDFAENPYVAWIYSDTFGYTSHTFGTIQAAKQDAEKKYGKIDWIKNGTNQFKGDYGPYYTAEEWLNLRQSF